MPKKNRVLTEINYSYLRPVNDTWVRSTYKKRGFSSRSEFMDFIVTYVRKNKLDLLGPQYELEEGIPHRKVIAMRRNKTASRRSRTSSRQVA